MTDPFDIPGPDEYMEAAFGLNGYLAAAFPGYKIRPGQLMLAKAVDDATALGEHGFFEGGCGIGKSFASLIPATYCASTTHSKVVVATANIALSEQYYYKDLPTLQKILPWNLTFGLLKGRNNYICLHRFHENESNGYKGFHGTPYERDELRSVQQWVQLQIADQDSSGDISDMEFQPSNKIWREFSVTGEECGGRDCKYYDDCFSTHAQAIARDSDIIVTNYHMLFSHIRVKMMTGLDAILPAFDIAICDEAHSAPNIARDFFGSRVTAEAFRRAANGLKHSAAAGLVEKNAYQIFDELRDYRRSKSYRTRLKEPLLRLELFKRSFEQLKSVCDLTNTDFDEVIRELRADISSMSARVDEDDPSLKEAKKQLNQLDKKRLRLTELITQLEAALNLEAKDEFVYFIEVEGRTEYAVLQSKPISVASTLRNTLFKDTKTVVCTSATLSTGGNFDFIAGELGCDNYSSLVAESPFDWPNQAMLVLPDDMVDPSDKENFGNCVADKLAEIIEIAEGRTLALFTSYKNLDLAYARLKDHPKYNILRQGQGGSRTKLIEEFKADKSSVLLGTESFWAGVDVPGDALSCVVIDRLPFPTPDDPILDAISEADPKGWFMRYSVPRAIIALKQGFGRLIRSTSDVGCVVVLDRRLRTARYSGLFLKSLPPVRLTSDIREIGRFLKNKKEPKMLVEPTLAPREQSEDDFLDRAFG